MNRKPNMALDLGMELVCLGKQVEEQEIIIDMLTLKAAKYKACFYGKYKLVEILDKQIEENDDYLTGAFDGFCLSSKRANAKYRSLKDMLREKLITESEYIDCTRL